MLATVYVTMLVAGSTDAEYVAAQLVPPPAAVPVSDTVGQPSNVCAYVYVVPWLAYEYVSVLPVKLTVAQLVCAPVYPPATASRWFWYKV